MQHALFNAIKVFRKWAAPLYPNEAEAERGWNWEAGYTEWPQLWQLYDDFLQTHQPETWSPTVIDQLLYIIARDNDSGSLARSTARYPRALIQLAAEAVKQHRPDAGWQLAVHLPELEDKQTAEALLEMFMQQEDEYMRRRALLSLARIGSDKTIVYCKIAWDHPSGEMLEYHRMTVLQALHQLHSPLLPHYLSLAKQDTSEYLRQFAQRIEQQLQNPGHK